MHSTRTRSRSSPHKAITPPAPGPHAATAQRRLRRLERVARRWDASLRVPFTRFRFGLDSIVGLVPGVGDLAGLAVSLWVVREARALGAPRRLQLRMLSAVLVEAVLGAVPLLGDLFDAAWKANLRNTERLARYLERQAARAGASAPDGP